MDNEIYLSYYKKNLENNNSIGLFESHPKVTSLTYLIRAIREDYIYALYINPSPTLEHYFDEIKKFYEENLDSTVIFCSDVCLPGLLKEGIFPDFVISLDISDKTLRYLKGHKEKFNLICPTAFPLYQIIDSLDSAFIFNAVEENEFFKIPPAIHNVDVPNIDNPTGDNPNGDNSKGDNPIRKIEEYYAKGREKSYEVDSLLREYKIYKKYPNFASRGTVLVTMYQIECKIKLTAGFYGSSLTITKDKPYASFISKANYEHICNIEPEFKSIVPSVDEYNRRIMLSYFNGDENLMNTYINYSTNIPNSNTENKNNEDVYIQPPLLKFYKDILIAYSELEKLPNNKTVIFK